MSMHRMFVLNNEVCNIASMFNKPFTCTRVSLSTNRLIELTSFNAKFGLAKTGHNLLSKYIQVYLQDGRIALNK